jgi:alginate O-acetyltransferase complex protein AlgI
LLFNSVAFLVFLPLVILAFYLTRHSYRWVVLLTASYVFYAWWRVEFLALIFISTLADYALARAIDKSAYLWKRRSFLLASMFLNLGMLFVFKYLNLFLPEKDAMLLNIFRVDHPFLGTILYGIYFAIPVGISFYTFQTMSYTIDVYKGRILPEKHLGKFALFVCYFPQLVAGPIERFSALMPQLKAKVVARYENFADAFRLMLWGFFIKTCIADNWGPLVDAVYEAPEKYNLISNWVGTLGFGFQIYADFAGYSLIAQGAALCFGVRLIDNFKTPYLAKTISEFWQRWHISLSTWFRDYLYIPLGGNRVTKLRWVVNILAVFILSGFWHGANWTFLIWGAIHGLLYLAERFVFKSKKGNLISALRTFIVVQIAWVFFRIDKLDETPNHFQHLISNAGETSLSWQWEWLVMFGFFLLMDVLLRNNRFDYWIKSKGVLARWSLYLILIWCIVAWAGVTHHPFIYFQF